MRTMLLAVLMVAVLFSSFAVSADAQTKSDLWAYAQMTAENGTVNVPLFRIRGYAPFQGRVITGEFDFGAIQLKRACVTDSLVGTMVTAGALSAPVGSLFPGPHEAFFSNAPEVMIAPPLFDIGGTISVTRGPLTLTAGLLSGEGPGKVTRTPSTDGVLTAKYAASGVTLVVLGQSGERFEGKIRQFGSVQGEWKHNWLNLGAGYAKRYDTEVEAAHAEVRVDLGFIEIGVRGEKPDRLTAAVVHPLAWKTAIAIEANFVEDRHAAWGVTLQYAVDFLNPERQ